MEYGSFDLKKQIQSLFTEIAEYWTKIEQRKALRMAEISLKPEKFGISRDDLRNFTLHDKAIIYTLFRQHTQRETQQEWEIFLKDFLQEENYYKKLEKAGVDKSIFSHIQKVIYSYDNFSLTLSDAKLEKDMHAINRLWEALAPKQPDLQNCTDHVLSQEATDEIIRLLEQNTTTADINLYFFIGQIRPALYDKCINNYKASKKTPRKMIIFTKQCVSYEDVLKECNSILHQYITSGGRKTVQEFELKNRNADNIKQDMKLNKLLTKLCLEWLQNGKRELEEAYTVSKYISEKL